jgi:hypothetical protein
LPIVIAKTKVTISLTLKEIVMPPAFGFDRLKDRLPRRLRQLPEQRKASPNTRYRIADAALSACGIFFTQSPSFLEYQRRLAHSRGQNNVRNLLGLAQIPCDNHMRTLLDPIAPSFLDGVFLAVFEALEQHRMLSPFRVLSDQLFVALDGTHYFSSTAVHCHNCLTRQLSNGQTLYYHAAITPVIVCPGQAQVLAVPPQYIMPQDGHAKQDCERQAGKRWLAKHGFVKLLTFLPDA